MKAVKLFITEFHALDIRKFKFILLLDIIRCLFKFLIALLLMKRAALDLFLDNRLQNAKQ